jgi:hypothetical protein
MTAPKITLPLIVGIAGTIGFDLSSIALGYGMTMNVFFLLYVGIMFVLSFFDRRVLGYATVLSACNPANYTANLSFSFLLAIVTIFRESAAVGRVIRELGNRRWWWLFLAAFLLVGLSVPSWPPDLRDILTEVKQALSRLGYLAAFPLAVGLTIRTRRDGVRAVSLLCLTSVAFLVGFYLWGQSGFSVAIAARGFEAIGVEQHIGNVYLNFNRTQVCIPLAALAAVALALGVSTSPNPRSMPYYVVSALCVYLIMSLASTGSIIAMVCGMSIVALGLLGVHLSLGRVLLVVILLSIVGSTLYWSVFHTENALRVRMQYKIAEIERTGIDRQPFWEDGIAEISKKPFGEGWSERTGHSDWLLFMLSYGWATGLLYVAAAGSLFWSMWRRLGWQTEVADRQSIALLLVGLAALSVYLVNSMLDMLSANIGYYETVWALILTPAAVMAIADAAAHSVERASSGLRQLPFSRRYRPL